MPRNICRVPTAQHSNASSASGANPAPGDDACQTTGESVPLSSTSALPTRGKHRERGRPRIYPRKTSFVHSLNPHLPPVKPGKGSREDSPTMASSPPVYSPASTEVSIVESATATNHLEAAQSAETSGAGVAVSCQLSWPLPFSPLPVPLSSRSITEALPLATGAPADPEQGGQEMVTFSSPAPSHTSKRVVAAASDSKTAVAATCAALSAEPLLPSTAACMAACFGWRLKRCSIDDKDQVLFVLRHQAVPVVRVTIESIGGAFSQACSASSETDTGAVRVNGALMSLTQCAAYLHQLTHALFNLSETSQSGPLTDHVQAEEENAAVHDGESVSSPSARAPSQFSSSAQVKAAERRAKKRARSRSPSRQAHSTAPVPCVTSLLSGITAPRLTKASAAAAGDDRGVIEERSQLHLPPLNSSTSPPAPAPLTTPPPAFSGAVDVKIKVEAPLFAAPPKRAEQKSSEDTTSLSAVAALVADMESSESSPPLPPASPASRTNAGKLSAASKRAASSADKYLAPREPPTSSTVFSSPTMRQRRALVPTTATAAAGAGSASPVSSAHHAPPFSPSPSRTGLRTGTFTMPFAFHHASAAPPAADVAPEAVNLVSGSKTRHRSLWRDSGGWSADSSRLWLAHTHAVSRTFECMPVPRFSALMPTRATERLDGDNAERQRTSAAEPASSSLPLMDTAAAAAFVRMTLRWRWRERSSIWTTMEDSLRMAVGSGHLRGDALEAGVQALQASEEEQRQYNRMDADADEEGDEHGLSCGRTAPNVGHAGHGPEQLQTPSFPVCPPRVLLPVSGRAVVEAQHRIADAEEDIVGKGGTHEPRYVACTGGIPHADRIVIDHTYSTRGSYVVAPPSMAEGSTATPCRPMTLQRNPQEDLHYHVYKRFMPTDMRVAMEAEGTLTVRPDGIVPLQEANAERPSACNLRRDQSGGEGDDNEDDEEKDDGVDEADEKKAFDFSTVSWVAAGAPAVTSVEDAGGVGPSTDMDYVLRYRPAIRRIPMPDVESRYGP